MTSIITELVYIFFKGPAEGRLRVREFLATLKTPIGGLQLLSALWSGFCLFGTFPISILNFINTDSL